MIIVVVVVVVVVVEVVIVVVVIVAVVIPTLGTSSPAMLTFSCSPYFVRYGYRRRSGIHPVTLVGSSEG